MLSGDVSRLKYVSGARQEALERLGASTVRDLLYLIPHRYLDFSRSWHIEAAPIGQVCTVCGTVDRVVVKSPRPRLSLVEVWILDDTGVMKAAFFRQPWIARQLSSGDSIALMGKVEFAFGFKQMSSPFFEKLDGNAPAQRIWPVHHVCDGISQAWMRRIVSEALGAVGSFVDPVPAALRAQHELMSLSRALRCIHFPIYLGEVTLARRRLAYDELLMLQLALRLRNDGTLLGISPFAHSPGPRFHAVCRALPFELSAEQRQAVDEICADMQDGEHIMNRLLLGDVGTGKTAVALCALAVAADTATQACLMAPTSVLARQHAQNLTPYLERAGIRCALLTGATPAKERAGILADLAAGTLDVLIGTHAVLSEDVRFAHLSLVVIDEQHRFGVGQRNMLRAKGPGADLLVTTATPIPRTMALSVYGDLETSIIKKRPRPGAGVHTEVLDESCLDIALGAIRDALRKGERAYVVCPLVSRADDEQELDDDLGVGLQSHVEAQPRLHSVEEQKDALIQALPEARCEVLHGRLSPAEKDAVIDAFASGECNLLVATTVVEVGVDVGQASVMVVLDADHFGLATLHQLRGRVGRQDIPGTCYLVARGIGSRANKSRERLEALKNTGDGFKLAEYDLRLRHEGEILGFRQHGGVTLRFVDLADDAQLIQNAHDDAMELLRSDRALTKASHLPLRYEIVRRYGNVFKEVSGG